MDKIARYIDHTLLKATAKKEDITKLCEEAKTYGFASVCVNPANVPLAKSCLEDSSVKVCTVIGFTLGANTTATKVYETKEAIKDGATEIDMVINVGKAKEGDFAYVEKEIRAVKEACGSILLKVIIETCYLDQEEIVEACKAAKNAGADFVKTSTGFGTAGAKVEDVALMRKTVGPNMGVKASGGIHSEEEAKAMLKAGANRLGTSASLRIIGAEK